MTKTLGEEVAELRANNARLRDALDSASYALFQIKRMPQVTATIVNHASTASEKACRVLDEIQNGSLAAIQAAAIKEAADNSPYYSVQNEPAIMRSDLIEYADKLGGKE